MKKGLDSHQSVSLIKVLGAFPLVFFQWSQIFPAPKVVTTVENNVSCSLCLKFMKKFVFEQFLWMFFLSLTSNWSPPCNSLTTTLRECGNGIFIFEARCSDFVNLISRRMTSGCCEIQILTENLFKRCRQWTHQVPVAWELTLKLENVLGLRLKSNLSCQFAETSSEVIQKLVKAGQSPTNN